MPTLTDEHKALIGKESEPTVMPDPVNQAMARHWCEMVEDPNPIYFDEAYARATWLQDTFAPPTMLYTWRMPPVWPEQERKSPAAQLELEGCEATVAVNGVQEYFMPLRYGDILSVTSKISAISEEKTTRLGTGHFVTTQETFRNQLGLVVGTHSFTLFRYRPRPGAGAE